MREEYRQREGHEITLEIEDVLDIFVCVNYSRNNNDNPGKNNLSFSGKKDN